MSADQIAHINRRHFTAEKLEAAIRDITNRFQRFTLHAIGAMRNGPLPTVHNASWPILP
jgi:hypothetical protein